MKRKSRSGSADRSEEDKFNFDVPEYEMDPSRPLSVSISRVNASTITGNDEADFLRKRDEISEMILPIEQHSICLDSEDKILPELIDPLIDEAYDNYHKKMVKQETRMMNDESNHSELEADRLQGILDHLEVTSWRFYLPKITVVNNPLDEEELQKKRELTQQTIRYMLKRYNDMKLRINVHSRKQRHHMIDPSKRLDKLFSKVDKSMIMGYHSSSDDEENQLNAKEVKKRRKHIKHELYSSPLIIPLSTPSKPTAFKYGIIAEPFKPPFVIKFSKDERLGCLKNVPNCNSRYHYAEQFPNQEMKFIKRDSTICELEVLSPDHDN
ncbi:unnamed protein product [Kluyveromyces dobzhanskii CBS 2104]|uniref:WGS project CCBQ000000000 data, contig 00049 n=1 Tax=Kluyveromyces dobzhanskii CBS 2104 TaxID=1427455 RepID=A0A0A8L564_9SACH|nr:unnamed protein product [Kluyveromyces dobzhanskii CBS 2104]